jgi:GNAT superfamily N-acetyltransferase
MTTSSARKCQAKDPSKCFDPNCPEKRGVQNAFKLAIANNDFSAYVTAKEQESKLTPVSLSEVWDKTKEYPWLTVNNKDTGETISVPVLPERKTYDADTNTPLKFDSLEDIKARYPYGKDIYVSVKDYAHRSGKNKLPPGFLLADIYVSPALRGQGAGQHVMTGITDYADQNNLSIELIATEAGDGTTKLDQPGHREAAIAHQKRLGKFYERNGFIKNPFYQPYSYVDYLTQEPRPIDREAQSKYTAKGAEVMSQHAEYVRFPKGKAPKGWMKSIS